MVIFNFIDEILDKMGIAFDKGFFYYIAVIGFILLISTVGFIVIYTVVKMKENPIIEDPEKESILQQIPAFCAEKGFNSWNWSNEEDLKFNCKNSTDTIADVSLHYDGN